MLYYITYSDAPSHGLTKENKFLKKKETTTATNNK